jgi:pimeloyl-ACP methyl ester carboxylesterase
MHEPQFACARARHRTERSGALDLHMLEWGREGAPGLCFLHGGSAHAHWFDGIAAPFADRYHVVSLDQRGHGESAWPHPPAYATEDFTGDLQRVFDALGWERAVVAGHSMGGHNAMAFSAWHPERVRGLVICDSRPSIPEDRMEFLRSRGERAARRPFPSRDAAVGAFRLVPRETVADPALLSHMACVGVVERDGGWLYRFDPDANRMRGPADCWPLLPRITAPTLIARAERSPVLPREHAERMLDLIPSATLVEIPDAYHHLTLDQPKAVIDALGEFLRRLDG